MPVYKTEKYLRRCIESILNQTFSDLELILVDDGSPDRCPQICEEYSKQDGRVKVIHKANAGVAAARNTGLDVVNGAYITFVDSDDWIEPNMYEAMMEKARACNCNVVMCDCVKDFSDHSELYSHDIRGGYYNHEQLKEEYYPHLLMMENVEYPATISNCLCLFRKRLIQQHNASRLRYIEGVRYSEDLLFGAQMMYQAESFYYMKGYAGYHYCMNLTSATHTFRIDKWNDYLVLYHAAEKFFCSDLKRNERYGFRTQTDKMLLFFTYNVIGGIMDADISRKEKLLAVKDILCSQECAEMFGRTHIIKLPIPWKLKVLTFLYKYKIGLGMLL